MPKKTYGPTNQKRVRRLLEALLCFVDGEFFDCGFDIQLNNWLEEDSRNPKLIVETTLVTLEWLTEKDKYSGKLTKAQIRNALKYLEQLQILEDNRRLKRGSDNWRFTLKLWSKDQEKNLLRFDEVWESNRPSKTKVLEANYQKNDSIATVGRPKTGIFQAPPLPSYYVDRPEVSQDLKQYVLASETAGAGTLVVSAIYGLGGIGKSTLAAALAHDREVQSHFSDGIFWATLGQQPDILSFLSTWIQALGDYDFKPINSEAASLQLRTLLSDKKALLVVDDAWHPEHVEPFRVGGSGCRVLVTTREAPVQGAVRYDLDVMTLEQSLELLTSCLDNKLTKLELELAQTLAKTVGYLPLALELAASQVSEGISWEELLCDLQAEIANLEALERWEAEEATSEAQRKNYSLVASFNLSLKGLSVNILENFAWLGVLPDDVTITYNMATTLWQCNSSQARKTLRYLRQKALLLPSVSSEQETNYRLHDLLHDLARSLLQGSTTPENTFQLPGLGLSIPEAHQQLLERYQNKTENGLWHTLPDDGYIYSQLIWHMEKAQKTDEIHQLLQEETPEGYNGWYWQCERQGKTANFVKDVSKAWAIAEANFTENTTESISLQCRYALITTSLNSLAGNIFPELIAALLEKEIWLPAQGLAYVRQIKDSKGLVEGLKTIIKYLPSSLLPEALAVARAIGDEKYRAEALQSLAPHLPEVLPEALDAARAIVYVKYRAEALVGLAPHLPRSLLPQALDATRALGLGYRTEALVGLAPHLPEVLPEALDAARAIVYVKYRADALVGLAPHLPRSLLPQALKIVRAIGDERCRADALVGLAPHLPRSLLPQVLDATRALGLGYCQGDVLKVLAPHLPESLLPQALEIARAIEYERYRADALVGLAHHLPEVFSEALDVARSIRDGAEERAEALQSLAPHLPESLLPQALDATRALGIGYCQADVLKVLAPHLPETLLPQALEIARAIGDERCRADALVGLAPHLPEVLPETLDAAMAIGSEKYRTKALQSLAPYLPESLLPQALDVARAIRSVGAIRSEGYRADALKGLAPYLPESLLPQALDAARAIGDEKDRAKALQGLAPHLPEVLPEALDAARAIGDEYYRCKALQGLAPHLEESLLPQALEIARAIGDEEYRADALQSLAPHLPEVLPEAEALQSLAPHLPEVLPEALDAARAIWDEYYRSKALQGLAPHLEKSLLPQALDAARAIGNEEYRADLLKGLASHLPESLLSQALEIARAIGSEIYRADALQSLAPHLPESLLSQALDATRAMRFEGKRAYVLQGLAPHLPESLLSQALDAARAIGNEEYRAKALQGLAPHLPEVLPEALDAARAIGDEKYKTYALQGLAPHLPESLLPQALEATRTLGFEGNRAKALQGLIERFTPSSVDFPLWQKTLHVLASLNRPHFLNNLPQLAPLIIRLGGVEALRETVKAVKDVSQWWK
ncbi:MAG: NB-ARC domain-containing protein [Coleofasciculaceae cyanobacterium]